MSTLQKVARRPECPDPCTMEMVERAISLQSHFKSREHLIKALPGDIGMPALERALELLSDSGKVAVDGDGIRWAAGARGRDGQKEQGGAEASESIFAGTFLEGIGDGKDPGETVGEYIVRRINTDEPGTFDGEEAKKIDEDLRRMAKGECYTYEELCKDLGL